MTTTEIQAKVARMNEIFEKHDLSYFARPGKRAVRYFKMYAVCHTSGYQISKSQMQVAFDFYGIDAQA